MFEGMQRTDRYALHHGLKCGSAAGGHDIGTASSNKTLADCEQFCAKDDDCTCINYAASTGTCRKQRYCHTEVCPSSSLADLSDTYTQHSTFKVGGGSTPQAQFERSGGRECSAADNATSLSSPVVDLSVTQCLQRCLSTTGCTCVRYERYYQSECSLQANCLLKTFCARSNRYDTYVKL